MTLLLDHDLDIARWTAVRLGVDTLNRLASAIGVLDEDGVVIGGCVLHNWSRYDMELSYYGPGTMTVGMLKIIAQNVVDAGCHRLTLRCSRRDSKRLVPGYLKLGFRYEGCQERLYGPTREDDAMLYGLVADRAERFLRRMKKAA